MTALHVVVGPAEHGVTRCADRIATRLAAAGHAPPPVRLPALRGQHDARLLDAAAAPGRRIHLHVTDHLFGASPEQAADRLAALGRRRPVSVTLHDLPQPSDGAERHRRRAECYAHVARAARGVVVSSEHERALLLDALRATRPAGPDRLPDIAVIPLAVDPPARRSGVPAHHDRPRDVALLGFVYPGKGHQEALTALRDLPADVGLILLGRPSDGHQDEVDRLLADARHAGRRCTVTGYVPDEDLPAALRAAAVPLAAHQHVSASGSIATWLGAGRRPLVARHRYSEELAARMPGALALYDDLPAALAAALEDPAGTWLPAGARVGPAIDEVVERYREVLTSWS